METNSGSGYPMWMKTKVLLSVCGVILLGGLLLSWPATGQPANAPKPMVEMPIGLECVVTVEMQPWMGATMVKPDPISGFRADNTLRGKIVHLGADWVVLKDGTYENWISRDKVLSVRVSR